MSPLTTRKASSPSNGSARKIPPPVSSGSPSGEYWMLRPKLRAVAQIILDLLAEPGVVDDDLGETCGRQGAQVILDQRHARRPAPAVSAWSGSAGACARLCPPPESLPSCRRSSTQSWPNNASSSASSGRRDDHCFYISRRSAAHRPDNAACRRDGRYARRCRSLSGDAARPSGRWRAGSPRSQLAPECPARPACCQ